MVRFRNTPTQRMERELAAYRTRLDPPSDAPPDIKGRLIRNALDFVVRATEELWALSNPGERELKYSTIHLYEAIELLLKARLMREHWSLVLMDQEISRKTRDDVEFGRFRSVDYKAAKDRLVNIAGVEIDGRADKAFDALRTLRNRYVHFECNESAENVLSAQLKAWHYVLELLEEGFLDPLAADERALLETASKAMLRSEAFLETRFEEVQDEIERQRSAGRYVATCPKCSQPALVFGDGEVGCFVCRSYWGDPTSAAEDYAALHQPFWKHPKHGVDDQIGWHSECGLQALAPVGEDLEEAVHADVSTWPPPVPGEAVGWGDMGDFYVCFNCGEPVSESSLETCSYCGELAPPSESLRCIACSHS